MHSVALIENKPDNKIGHGFLVTESLLITCAHVVGDVDAENRPFAHDLSVTFKSGEKATARLHALGWFPHLKDVPWFPADVALLTVEWPQKASPSHVVPFVQEDEWPHDAKFILSTTKIHGRMGNSAWGDSTGRAWTSPALKPFSVPSLGDKILEFVPDDDWSPKTEQGWSGSPVIAKLPDGTERVVGMWNGAPVEEQHRGHALTVSVLQRAVKYCMSPAPIWKGKAWKPFPFSDEVRARNPLPVEKSSPVTGQVRLRQPSDLSAEQDARVSLAMGIAGVCSLEIEDAGTICFGAASARLELEVSHMTLQPFNRIDLETSQATAVLETIPSAGGDVQTATYVLAPRKSGDVLFGNALAKIDQFETDVATATSRAGSNRQGFVSATLIPDFRVVEVFEREPPGSDDEVREFKKFLIEQLAEKHAVKEGAFRLSGYDDD